MRSYRKTRRCLLHLHFVKDAKVVQSILGLHFVKGQRITMLITFTYC